MIGVIHANATGIIVIQIDVGMTGVGQDRETDPAETITEEAAQGLMNDPEGAKLRRKWKNLRFRTFEVI